jgi:nitroreductase/dihydropteridine reductase
MQILEALEWRYAPKRMTGERLPQEKVDIVLEAARLAPTADGIQPFSIVHITNRQLLEKIRPIAYYQAQVTEASHLLVFAAWNDVTPESLQAFFARCESERGLAPGTQAATADKLKVRFAACTAEQRAQWAARQTYIALGVAIAAAALEKIDAAPMEGFRNAELDRLLNLPEKGLRSHALLALGYRDLANDKLVGLKKVRRPKEELIIYL